MPSTCFLAPSLLPLLSAPQHPGVPKWGCEGPGQGVPGGGCSQRVLPAGQDGHLLTATTTLEYDSTYADEEEEEEEEDYEATPEQPAADGELRRGRGAGLPRATSTTSPRPRVPASPQPLPAGSPWRRGAVSATRCAGTTARGAPSAGPSSTAAAGATPTASAAATTASCAAGGTRGQVGTAQHSTAWHREGKML